jgi:hypothetical protein
MGGISLMVDRYRRSAAAPGTTAAVKPPFELADRSGQIATFDTLATGAAKLWGILIETQAANEYHTFMGEKNSILVELEKKLQETPGISIEDIGKLHQGAMADITKASINIPKTRQGKNRIGNWMARNGKALSAQMEASSQAILMEREEKLAAQHIQIAQEAGDYVGIANILNDWVKAQQLTPEQGEATTRLEVKPAVEIALMSEVAGMGQESAMARIDDINERMALSVEEGGVGLEDLFGEAEIAAMKKRYEIQKRYAENALKLANAAAVLQVGVESAHLGAAGDWGAAQRKLDENIDILGLQEWTTQSRNLQTMSNIVANGGQNWLKTTHKPSVKAELRKDILSGRITDDAFIWQKVGENGISESDATLLSKMIPDVGSARDYRDNEAAQTYDRLFKRAVDKIEIVFTSAQQEDLAFETGHRWLEDWQKNNPEATMREQDEQAMRIVQKIREKAEAGRLPTTIEGLPGARRAPISPSTGHMIGLGEIWDDLDAESRLAAIRLLGQGAKPEELIAHFKSKK